MLRARASVRDVPFRRGTCFNPKEMSMNVKHIATTSLAVVVGMVIYQKFVAGKI